MRLEEKPMFKKPIVPWHETERACFFLIIVMFLFFLIGFFGTSVSLEETDYREFVWMPILLMVLSGIVIISTSIRLIKRYINRLSK
ncbi:hypothetical protein ACFLZM_06560 [Thermodesulfobacteriota bacterium]